MIPNCANPNITTKLFAYSHTTRKTVQVLIQLSKRARGFVLKHWEGAILVETEMLKVRLSPHLTENRAHWREHDVCFPSEMCFHNPLVGFMHIPGRDSGFNYILQDGTTSEIPCRFKQ